MQAGRAGRGNAEQLGKTWEYRLVFVASYPIFLVCEILESVLGLRRKASASRPCKSLFARTRDTANTCLPYAFLG
jgi:hypothetical protein